MCEARVGMDRSTGEEQGGVGEVARMYRKNGLFSLILFEKPSKFKPLFFLTTPQKRKIPFLDSIDLIDTLKKFNFFN